MPIAKGIMIIQRFTVIQTSTEILSKTPSSGSLCNQNVVYQIMVSPEGTPDGSTVELIDTFNNSILASGTLTSGQVTLNHIYNNLIFNEFQVIARYLGSNGNPLGYSPSTSIVNFQDIIKESPTVTVGTIPSTICFGNDYTITATVTSSISANNPITDGYVRFVAMNGMTPFIIDGYSPLVSGVATSIADGYDGYTMVWPSPTGTYPIHAEYYPTNINSCFLKTDSANFTVTVQDFTTTTTITSVSPPTFAHTDLGNVTITAMVTSGHAGTIDGYVVFGATQGSILLGSGTITSGIATITPLRSAFVAGSQLVTAKFFGDFASGDCYGVSSDGYAITVT